MILTYSREKPSYAGSRRQPRCPHPGCRGGHHNSTRSALDRYPDRRQGPLWTGQRPRPGLRPCRAARPRPRRRVGRHEDRGQPDPALGHPGQLPAAAADVARV